MDIVGLASVMALVTFVLFAIFLPLAIFAFWVWMLIDCIQHKFKNENDRIVWILIIALLSAVGASIYYFGIKRGMIEGGGRRGR